MPQKISPAEVEKFLGAPKFLTKKEVEIDRPGVVHGLAWTPTGGELLTLEVAAVPTVDGKNGGALKLTGKLGDVMRESAEAALTFVRANFAEVGVPENFLAGQDLHLHAPEAAIGKDGPSAGVAIALALVSLFSGKKLRPDFGVTGEITLGGRVLPIGGLREKSLAAERAGLRTIAFPAKNARDAGELPDFLREKLELCPIETFADAAKIAFEK